MNLKFMRRVSEREGEIRQFVIVKNQKHIAYLGDMLLKKQIDVSFYCACSLIDNEFRHHIVKVVCYLDNVMTKFMINNRTDA